MRSYKDLEIYQLSFDLAVKIHRLTLKLPKYEQYEEGRQIRKSSCDETIVHLNFLKDTHENFIKDIIILLEKYDELGAKINKYIQYVEKEWK